jgi:hypothetical protein
VTHAYNPSYSGDRDQQDNILKPSPGKCSWDPILKILNIKKGWRVVQVVEHLPSKCEALSTNKQTNKQKSWGGKNNSVSLSQKELHTVLATLISCPDFWAHGSISLSSISLLNSHLPHLSCLISPHPYLASFSYSVFSDGTGFELRALCLLGRYSSIWDMPPVQSFYCMFPEYSRLFIMQLILFYHKALHAVMPGTWW